MFAVWTENRTKYKTAVLCNCALCKCPSTAVLLFTKKHTYRKPFCVYSRHRIRNPFFTRRLCIHYAGSSLNYLSCVAKVKSVVKKSGLTASPLRRISQCKCGPVASPVIPLNPIKVPLSTMSPSFTERESMW